MATLREDVRAWRDEVARGASDRLRGDADGAKRHLAAADDLQRSIEAHLRAGAQEGLLALLPRIRGLIERAEAARLETERGLPGEDPAVLGPEVDTAIAALVRVVPSPSPILRALDATRVRLRVHADGPFLETRAAIDKLADVEGARLIDATRGAFTPLEARAVLRGELYSLVLASPRWKWFAGDVTDRAIRAGQEALIAALQRAGEPWPTYVRLPGRPLGDGGVGPPRDLVVPRLLAEARPTRVQFEALLIQIARQIQEEVPAGEGAEVDVQQVTYLWRWALTPFLRAFYAREHPAASADELRGPFDSLVHDLVELAFRELGHTRISAPPFGGRSAAAWLVELRRRRATLVNALEQQETASAGKELPFAPP